jgi:hypothetical protein
MMALTMVIQSSPQKTIEKSYFLVHPINARREEEGLFYNLFNDLRNNENKFFSYFRMSNASFDVLYDTVAHTGRVSGVD